MCLILVLEVPTVSATQGEMQTLPGSGISAPKDRAGDNDDDNYVKRAGRS